MDANPPQTTVTVHPPGPDGARPVTAGDRKLGVAHRIEDLVKFLRHVGLDDIEIEETDLIEWQGGGPESWDAL
ncbi:hypothetical protein AB0D04_06855 [Streptomyces sp. NPDC048483]|uniref:hypothetical protein n=1 Tax=Streptomyces sp. NPDC048483 TaxID=3154927 RepID=UPI0034140571